VRFSLPRTVVVLSLVSFLNDAASDMIAPLLPLFLTATLGGGQLAVSRYSKHPVLAASLVMYLTGRDEQRRRAIVGGFNPTLPELYRDAEVLRANPYLGTAAQAFAHAVPRPAAVTGTRYNRVSTAFWSAVHAVLAGQSDARTALGSLERNLLRLSRGGRW